MEIKRIVRNLLEWVYPSQIYCMSCGRVIGKEESYSLCVACYEKISKKPERACQKCGKPLSSIREMDLCMDCMANMPIFTKACHFCVYNQVARNILYQYKFAGRSYFYYALGEMMSEGVTISILNCGMDFDIVMAVPLHQKKQQSRGFNQAELMGKAVAETLKKPYVGKCLQRVKQTRPMRTLSGKQRKENIANAFSVKKANLVAQKRILLVDDILTTGSTVNECAKKLFECDAKAVYVVTFAATWENTEKAIY